MRNFKKLSQVEVEVVTPWVAVLVPRLVSKLNLEVMSSCLVRQGREVEAGIASLQANLPDSEARIKQGHIQECVHAAAGLLPAHHDGAR